MKRLFIVFLLIGSFAMPLPSLYAQRRPAKNAAVTTAALATQRGADVITAAQMRAFLYFIASDEMEGRDTPSRGLDTTAKFIAMNLGRWGFKPAGDNGTFFQRIALRRDQLDGSRSSAEINGQKFNFGDDFLPNTVSATITGPLVYVGRGWIVQSKNMDDYKGIEVKDKIMVVFGQGLPPGLTQADMRANQGQGLASPANYAR